MAFGDSNDIKINVTVNTADAKKAAKEIGEAFKAISKDIGTDFKTIANISKDFANVRIAQIKAESAEEIQRSKERTEKKLAAIKADVEKFTQAETTKRETAKATSDAIAQVVQKLAAIQREAEATKREDARQTAKVEIEKLEQVASVAKEKQKTRTTQIRAANALAIQAVKEETNQVKVGSQERIKIRLLEADQFKINLKNNLQIFKVSQATIRSENKITAEELRLEAAKVRQETVKLQKGLSDAGGAGKAFNALRSAFLGASVGIGPLTVGVGTLASTLGPTGLLVGGIGVATAALVAFGAAAFKTFGELAEAANKVQGLSTAFTTLQQSLARDPVQSIQRLREATQGLISDTDLYQKANQAVLLGVPAKLFDESAEAAVKLGRAMGIDARFALESLSIGLGRQSRLYLDNLGIVVSATEAYRKYGQAVGKSANDLSDAEKRQAFFNETSTQLREGLARLPEIQDDVGIAYTKLNTLTQNASDAFLRSFNSSTELEGGTRTLRDSLERVLIPAFEKLGAVTASVFNGILSISNTILPDIIEGWGKFAETLDIVFFKSQKTRNLQLALEIKSIREELDALNKQNERFKDLPIELRQRELNKASELQAKLNSLQEEQNKLLGEEFAARNKNANVPLRVENEETLSNISETESAIAGLKKKIEEDLGVIRLPGLDLNQVKQFEPELDAVFKSIETGALKGEAAGLAVEAAVKKISVALGEANKKVTELDIERVAKALEAKPDDSNLKLELETLRQRLKLQTENIDNDERQRAQAVKFALERQRLVKKGIQDDTAAGKRGGDILKQRQKEIEGFVRTVARQTNSAIPPQFEQKLADLYKKAIPGTKEFIEQLKLLGEEALAAGVDLQALAKSAGSLEELAAQGVPLDQIPSTDELREAAAEYNKNLQDIQDEFPNIRDFIFGKDFEGGKKTGGGFFGFDIGGIDITGEQEFARATQQSITTALQMAIDGIGREDAQALGATIGTAVGAGIGAYFGDPATGAAIGNMLGGLLGKAAEGLGKDTPGTRERKEIDKYFADAFDGNRLGVVIEGEVFKAVKPRRSRGWGSALGGALGATIGGALTLGIAAPVGAAVGAGIGAGLDDARNQLGQQIKETIGPTFITLGDLVFSGFTKFAGDVKFGVEAAGQGFNAFSSYFNTLSADVQNSFTGIGLAFGKLNGIASEEARLIGTALANNIGGNLVNLQILIEATGESFQNLSEAIIESFLNQELSIDEAYNSLLQLQKLYAKGIPDAIGAVGQAIKNFNDAIKSNAPGRVAIKALKDIAEEGKEANRTFQDVVTEWATSMGLGAEEVQLLFAVLKSQGITSLDQLAAASNSILLGVLKGVMDIKNGVIQTVDEANKLPRAPEPTAQDKASGSGKKSKAQIAAEERAALIKQQIEEARSLTAASKEYQAIVEKIANGILTQEAGGRQLLKLQQEILAKVKQRDSYEKKINEELDKGAGANAKLIAEYEKKLKKIEDRLAKINEEVETSTNKFKNLNIEGILPLIKDSNNLGVVSRIIGVDLKTNIDILIEGFRRGKYSIAQVNAEIAKTQDLLGDGIPEASGAVDQAFKNLIDAGEKGGEFSLDAFSDIFAEYRERFNKEGSLLREQQRKQLLANFDATKAALLTASGPEQIAAAQAAFKDAEESYNNFIKNVPKPDLAGLREELLRTFAPEEVDKFFRALDESGMSSFEDFEKAGDESVIKILGRLKELGFQFNKTTGDIAGINNGLNQAAKEANGGKDPLDEALRLVQDLNNATGRLPAAFNETGNAAGKLNGPLKKIADSIKNTLDKLSQLSGNKFNNDVIFNVKTTGDSSAQALVELLFGPGDLVSDGTGNGKTGKTRTVKKTLSKNEKPKR
jgi:hypothetical protein